MYDMQPIRWLVGASLILLLLVSGSVQAQNENGRGRHKQIYVVPAPGAVVIDGKFDDWDLSGQIEMFVVEQTRAMQSAKFALMHDEQALYVSGDVNDPTPMMNRHDPQVAPDKAWDADSCQFRLTVDPAAGYPINENGYDYTGGKVDTRDDIVHLLLWNYTDLEQANLQMHVGMSFRVPQPEWIPKGLVPQGLFTGKYIKREDGSGYRFEYRIPWSVLGAKRPLRGGDTVAGTVQFNWSRPDGLKTGGQSAWAYDIMGKPGFAFQSTACWGKMIFSETGDIPRELVTAGVPPEPPMPLEFAYTLPQDSETTVQLFDKNGRSMRIIVPQQARLAGKNVERWDGLDSDGNVLPAGEYSWKGIYHNPITARYRFSVHNSGTPPYPTDDNKGGWGADHGYPADVWALKDGMLLSWDSCEFGWGIIRTDLYGKKLWGSKHIARHMASDGSKIFIAGGHGFTPSLNVIMIDVKDTRPARFENGVASIAAPPGGDNNTNEVTGLVYHNGLLYIAYAKRNLVAVFETTSGDLKAQWNVPAPGRMAMRPDGSLAVISDEKIVSVKDGNVSPWIATNIDGPISIAVAADGVAYVANRGAMQNVSVFTADGRYLRSIGTPGGRPAIGKYDKEGLYMAGGMTLDAQGRLWVAETTDSPKRFSVWDVATGANLKEFFGGSGYFAYGNIDPNRPNEILAHNVLWEIDWKNYTSKPLTTVWRQTDPNMAPPVGPEGYVNVARMMTAANGRQYMWGANYRMSLLLRRDGDVFKPFAAIMRVEDRKSAYYRSTGIALVDSDAARYPVGHYFWQDENDDQIVQPAELLRLPKDFERNTNDFIWLDKDLKVQLTTGQILRPVRIEDNGQPRYDITIAEKAKVDGSHYYYLKDDEGRMYTKGGSLSGYSADGARLWYYPNMINWPNALNLPMVKAGRLWGMTGSMGVAGDFIAQQTYYGPNHIFRNDGQYVAAVLSDGRGGSQGAYDGQPEGQGGTFVKLSIDGTERYFIIHGGQDTRIWEVLGLDTIQDLPGGVYVHTPEMVEKTKQAQAAYAAALKGEKRLVIAQGKQALDTAAPVGKTLEDGRNFATRMAYDADNLYVRYDVRTPSTLLNASPEPSLIFKGGNLLDIQLATDATADPARKTPAPDDLRLLVTRQGEKTVAVLFRPKIKGFNGEPIVLTSPTGKESFDSIEVLDDIQLEYSKTDEGFTATVTIPLKRLGLTLAPGQKLKADLGYIFGNAEGTRTTIRAYVFNHDGFSANVVDDIPNESRLEPAEWGEATVE